MKNLKDKVYDMVPTDFKMLIKSLMPRDFYSKRSFAQCGEDIIIKNICNSFCKDRNVRYIDIGANHPFSLSNTALLYFNNKPHGGGVLVEPNLDMAKLLKKRRRNDIVLNAGISPHGKEELLEFYMMDLHVLNTFSKEEASLYEQMGHRIINKIGIQTLNINNIFEKHFKNGEIDFMNLDTEGLDFDILTTIDYNKYKPRVICAETVDYRPAEKQSKQDDILNFLKSKGYRVYGETGLNTIFVKE